MKRADISFCAALIGKPWVSGATGPDSFDCWGLVRFVLKHRKNLELSPYRGVSETGLADMMRSAHREALVNWHATLRPEHLCCVAMSRGRRVEHVGLWLDDGGGGVFHCQQNSGVVFQSQSSIQTTGFKNFTYYKFRP